MGKLVYDTGYTVVKSRILRWKVAFREVLLHRDENYNVLEDHIK